MEAIDDIYLRVKEDADHGTDRYRPRMGLGVDAMLGPDGYQELVDAHIERKGKNTSLLTVGVDKELKRDIGRRLFGSKAPTIH